MRCLHFTATIESPKESKELVEGEEKLMESKFEKMNEEDDIHTAYLKFYKNTAKHGKLYRLVTRKLREVELEQKELSTKVDEANQSTEALRFVNNFLVRKPRNWMQSCFR